MHETQVINWIDRARALGPQLAEHADQADRGGAFVARNFGLLRTQGFLAAGIPTSLGGGGASHAEVCDILRELARHCGSTALALSMHQHLVAATVFRHLHGQPGEALLKRIVAEGLVLVSTGAGDWLRSNGVVTAVEGGYRVSARKHFASASPVGDLMITSAFYDDPERGPSVIHFPLSMRSEGVRIGNDWDALGMRGTGSNTIDLENVFVPQASVSLQRPAEGWHTVWSLVLTVAAPIYMAPYVGVAEAAASRALTVARKQAHDGPTVILAGELENQLTMLRLAYQGAVDNARNLDFTPDTARANQALIHKTLIANHAIATVEKAMELVGGRSYLRMQGLERLFRDVHGAPNHPLPEKKQQWISGRLALGLDPV